MAVETLVVTIVIAMAVPANTFPVLYTMWTNWWQTVGGRHLFFFTVGLAALIDLSLIRRFFGTFPGFELLAIATYLLICWQLWRRLWLLVKHNRPGRRVNSDGSPTNTPRRRSDDTPKRTDSRP